MLHSGFHITTEIDASIWYMTLKGAGKEPIRYGPCEISALCNRLYFIRQLYFTAS